MCLNCNYNINFILKVMFKVSSSSMLSCCKGVINLREALVELLHREQQVHIK